MKKYRFSKISGMLLILSAAFTGCFNKEYLQPAVEPKAQFEPGSAQTLVVLPVEKRGPDESDPENTEILIQNLEKIGYKTIPQDAVEKGFKKLRIKPWRRAATDDLVALGKELGGDLVVSSTLRFTPGYEGDNYGSDVDYWTENELVIEFIDPSTGDITLKISCSHFYRKDAWDRCSEAIRSTLKNKE